MVCYNAEETSVEERIEEPPHGGHPVRDPVNFSFESIDASSGGVNILKNVQGTAEHGQLLTVMGPSGSGKTTLFECLSGNKKVDRGVIAMNGEVLNKKLRRRIAYVRQEDILKQNMTVRDLLEFHASLRLHGMTSEEKMNYLDFILDSFNMNDPKILNTKITPGCGLSGGEKKRINIMCELMANHPVLLLDEPTTGLDSFNAYNLINGLKNMAMQDNKTIILTIHQPSSQIMMLFDQLLLLSAGEVAYFGRFADVVEEMNGLGFTIKPFYNTGDFLLELLHEKENRDKIVEEARRKREEGSTVNEIIPIINGNANVPALNMEVLVDQGTRLLRTRDSDSGRSSMFSSTGNSQDDLDGDKWAVSFWQQVAILTKREFLCSSRGVWTKLNMVHTGLLTGAVSTMWFRVKRIEENIQTIDGFNFFASFIWSLSTTYESLHAFSAERAVIDRERQSGLYRLLPYVLAKFLSTILVVLSRPLTFRLVTALCFGHINASAFFLQMGIMALNVHTAESIGLFISSLGLGVDVNNVICSLVCIPSALFSDHLAPNRPDYISWLQYGSPMFYSYEAMRNVEYMYGDPVKCAVRNSVYDACRNGNSTFIPPIDILGGEDSIISTSSCIWICVFLSLILRLLTYLNLRFIKSPTRPR